jgi:hypothetical protein
MGNMSRPRVSIDKYTPDAPVRVEYSGAHLHYSRTDAHDLYEQLGGVLMELDPPDTMPPPADTEPGTIPDSPVAIRRSSDHLAAVNLSDTKGLAARVAEELAAGKK